MLGSNAKQWMLAAASAAILVSSSLASAQTTTNINLAVASNFYGFPPSNSAITDLIVAFQAANPGYTVTVVDNGSTGTLADNIINGNTRGVDLFLAADTETPQDLLINHFDLVTPYNHSLTPALYTFDYAQGLLALLTNSRWVDLSCTTGTCGYDPEVYSTVAIADPSVAPYGAAAQAVLTGRYRLLHRLSLPILRFTNIQISPQRSMRLSAGWTRWGLSRCRRSVPRGISRPKETGPAR
jgi:molybdate transport system substrate-binding protein